MKHKHWTAREIEQLRSRYPHEQTQAIAESMGRPARSVYFKASKLGLRKSPAFLASGLSGRLDGIRGGATRFKKGHTPANKGLRRPGWSSGRMAETQFRKGNLSGSGANRKKPIGTERVSRDGYLERKINDDLPLQRRWRAVHLLNWEAANGPLPPGHAVTFIDGNKMNTELSNLRLLPRADLMRRNTVHNLPKPLAELVQLRGALVRKINRRLKAHEEQA